MKRFILVLASVLFLSGCISESEPSSAQGAPSAQFVCPDGVNVVANLNLCPPYDQEYEECLDMDAASDYYGSSARDQCFFNLALQRENASLCKKVLATDSYYSEYSSGRCGALLAMSEDDASVCEGLGMVGKYDCYAELATMLEDASMCDYVTLSSKKDDCLYTYFTTNSYYIDDWSFCDKFSEKSDNRDYCFNTAAYNSGSVSYCDKIQGDGGYYGYSQAGCYASVARQNDDPGVCSGLSTSPKRDDCFYDYAMTYPYDETACNRIVDGSKKSRCANEANYSYY
ncbi:MAG: hypothetical protein V1827_03825 [Candidatus Micrarchaeota archaeon]